MGQRLTKLLKLMDEQQLDAFLVTKPENRMYLSGFTGTSGMLYNTRERSYLITDARYTEQAAKEAPDYEIVQHGTSLAAALQKVILQSKSKRIGFEHNHVTMLQYQGLMQETPDAVWVGQSIDMLRRIKDGEEINALRKAAALADKAFVHILSYLKPGVTEKDVALELEYYMRRAGAEKNAFDFIVASGKRSSLPHGVASEKTLHTGDLVTLDFGCVFNHYCSDITRTVGLGNANPQLLHIYEIVRQAQQAALQALRPDVRCCDADKVAREIIACHGYGQYFGHGLGHGVGLAIHEEPRLSPSDNSVLQPGMVVTVEPGIYVPDLGGVRIEDTVLITTDGCERLTHSSKDYIIL